MTETTRSRPRLWRRRWVWIVVLLAVVVRAALPELLRRVAVDRASAVLGTRVEIGDVDLALLRGGVALEGVALYSPQPPEPDAPPLVAWDRFLVQVRWIPLLWKTVRLRTVEIDAPRVALDHLAGGEFNVEQVGPPAPPDVADVGPPAPSDEAEAPDAPAESAWKIGIDRLVLTRGGLRFRDLTLAAGEPLELVVPNVVVEGLGLAPGVYEGAGAARVTIRSEGGALRVSADLEPHADGFALGVRLKAHRLPLARARLYVPEMGWSEIAGLLDAALEYDLAPAPAARNAVRGLVRLRDVTVGVQAYESAVLELERLAVWIESLDLTTQRIIVGRVAVHGAEVVADLRDGAVLPILGAPGEADPAGPVEEPEAESGPWHWRLGALHLTDVRVGLLHGDEVLEVPVDAVVRDLADDARRPGHVEVRAGVSPGTLTLVGSLRVAPFGFGGTLEAADVPVHELVRASRALTGIPEGLLRSAVLAGDLSIEAGLGAEGGTSESESAVRISGPLHLDALDVSTGDPPEFALEWKELEMPVDELLVPWTTGPVRVALGAVRLVEPKAVLTRTADGIVLPVLGSEPEASTEESKVSDTRDASAEPPGDAVVVACASLAVRGGRVDLRDHTLTPPFSGALRSLRVDAHGVRWPGPTAERFTLATVTPQRGRIDVTGALRSGTGSLELEARELALSPYNPFVSHYSPYSLGARSGLSVTTRATMEGGRYDAKTALTLHRLTVEGGQGDTLFTQQFGIPLSMALALLRDLDGDIKLAIPVTVDESATTIGLGTVVGGALRSALTGALTSPLKLLGAAVGSGDDDIAPAPIGVETGRATLTAKGVKQVGKLGRFLATRPAVSLELDPIVTPVDVRWLAEQALAADLGEPRGLLGTLGAIGDLGAQGRIREALAARAAGEPGALDEDDAAELDEWLAERPPVAAEVLRALAAARAASVTTVLREAHGIDPARLAVLERTRGPRDGHAGVALSLGFVGD